ncbi:MAG: clan AA aspartic protease [Armatimonadetes bacterium CG_4_10_14_3_um_filter_66_18]|nr:clan AA aspartic protease [Armatimonadota bacterium]OIP12396.1 MAG: clan AA aspartic protease [Armatimonadetes bacterium CG2_30_66_41]PIU93830.1 MAG: clan AA aspartic protease [Armatimonadetes bacterium CG06_land_8_20_14_3_00_66_21]PIX38163.1 MAG: clan AA aspartic protease [Armatimonadetes bacterium CG_4_8_14_3_um_filter_66_20]PIY53359.1 MAG: clan AA aspartic protease [Armatimonadetes bacterium CG_4_10_14_3_um_filter_66_18]PIZ40470.1 MAG: clan AA aspartic protease [Armatimonadetes bacterium
MGEVRVEAVLTNEVDETLAAEGRLAADQVRRYKADALVDTGAVRLVIPQHVADALGLRVRGTRGVEYTDGRNDPVPVTSSLVIQIAGRDTVEEALILGDEVLIGQAVLEKTDMYVDCVGQRLIPNPAHPDQPVTKVKRAAPHG